MNQAQTAMEDFPSKLQERIKPIQEALCQLESSQSLRALQRELEQIKIDFLGKKGFLSAFYAQMGQIAPQERKSFGAKINETKSFVQKEITLLEEKLQDRALELELSSTTIDVSAPSPRGPAGSIHPSMALLEEMVQVLSHDGFRVITSPNIDTDQRNFGDLNFPPEHPARDMQDTFYLSSQYLLRTHTSNGQVLAMQSSKPPIRVVIPGRCFRSETITARSHILFHQLEGLYIDEGVSMSDLLATMRRFFQRLFSDRASLRFRPSFFPFVEPGIEVDLSCLICGGKGCAICKDSGWLEVAGAGMVHPHVLRSGGIDPEYYSGFAWGMGIERLVMILKGIDDIRLFTQGRTDFLSSFPSL